MGNEERKCDFAVITSDGKRPDVEIHMVGFKEEGGVRVCGHICGSHSKTVMMACEVVKAVGKKVAKECDVEAAGAYANLIGMALAEAIGEEGMKAAAELVTPEGIKKKISGVLDKLVDDIAREFGAYDEGVEEE